MPEPCDQWRCHASPPLVDAIDEALNLVDCPADTRLLAGEDIWIAVIQYGAPLNVQSSKNQPREIRKAVARIAKAAETIEASLELLRKEGAALPDGYGERSKLVRNVYREIIRAATERLVPATISGALSPEERSKSLPYTFNLSFGLSDGETPPRESSGPWLGRFALFGATVRSIERWIGEQGREEKLRRPTQVRDGNAVSLIAELAAIFERITGAAASAHRLSDAYDDQRTDFVRFAQTIWVATQHESLGIDAADGLLSDAQRDKF